MKQIVNKVLLSISVIIASLLISTPVLASETDLSSGWSFDVEYSVVYDSWSLSAGEGISLNLYYTVTKGDASNLSVYVNGIQKDKKFSQTNKNEFSISIPVSPKALGDNLNISFNSTVPSGLIELYLDAGNGITDIKTDRKVSHDIVPRRCLQKMYNDEFAGSASKMSSYNDLKNLCRAIENYGYASQKYFGYKEAEISAFNGDSIGNPENIDDYRSESFGALPDGITYIGSSLFINDKISVRHYFEIADDESIENYIFTYANKEVHPVESSGSRYYVQSKNINVFDYSDIYVLDVEKINSESKWSLTYGPYSYAVKVSEKGGNEDLWTLCKSIYWYNENLKKYLASQAVSRECGHANVIEQEDKNVSNRVMYFCGDCGLYLGSAVTGPGNSEHEHNMVLIEREESTCLNNGYELYRCSVCSEEERTELPKSEQHDYQTIILIEPTYEMEGLKYVKCSVCKEVKPDSYEDIPKLVREEPIECQHESYYRKLISAATCVTYSQYQKICNTCGEVIGTTRGIKYGDHPELVKEETRKPSYSMEGEYTYYCNLCGRIVKKEPIPKLDVCIHNGSVYSIDFGDGTRGIYCCDCDVLIRVEDISTPICYHKTTKQVMNTPPTSTTDGIVDVVCAECGKNISTQTIHAYSTYTIDIGGGKTDTVCGYFDDDKAQEVFRLLNEYRTLAGLRTLNWAPNLDYAARLRTVESAYLFGHTRPNNEKWWQLDAVYMTGENLAAGPLNAMSVMAAWKSSEGHNANMLQEDFQSVNTTCFVRLFFGDNPDRLTPEGEIHYWAQEFSQFAAW